MDYPQLAEEAKMTRSARAIGVNEEADFRFLR
jgi:hypothetical protein